MIIAAFTHGLRGGELFKSLLGRDWRDAEEMLEFVNIFLRRESENAENLKLEGRGAEVETKDQRSEFPHQARHDTRPRLNPVGQFPRNTDRFASYRHETHDVATHRFNPKAPLTDKWKYLRDPNQYCDFHKKWDTRRIRVKA